MGSVKEKLEKVEEFSEYLISPLRKRYDTVFKSTSLSNLSKRSQIFCLFSNHPFGINYDGFNLSQHLRTFNVHIVDLKTVSYLFRRGLIKYSLNSSTLSNFSFTDSVALCVLNPDVFLCIQLSLLIISLSNVSRQTSVLSISSTLIASLVSLGFTTSSFLSLVITS